MSLRRLGDIELPPHAKAGGFDHAAVHGPSGRLFVAHTANDAIDVVDVVAGRYVESIPGLAAVAGALISETPALVFTSNRGENTVGIFAPAAVETIEKVAVGVGPNGLAYDPGRRRLLVAHVGDPAIPGSASVEIVDVPARRRVAEIPMPGRTRWTVFDPVADRFIVNIADPPLVVMVDAAELIAATPGIPVPSAGPHGLDLDVRGRRLFCACDGGRVFEIDADRGTILRDAAIGGAPDVVFFDPARDRLYVAIGDPGVIDVIDTTTLARCETVMTGPGAHTLALDADRQRVYAFLPENHRAAVFVETG